MTTSLRLTFKEYAMKLCSLTMLVFLAPFPASAEELPKDSVIIKDSIKSLDALTVAFKKKLLDKKTSIEDKQPLAREIYGTYLYYPDSCRVLVPPLADMLIDHKVSDSTKKWILQIFRAMGPKASGAAEAIIRFMHDGERPGRRYTDLTVLSLGAVAPKDRVFLQTMMTWVKDQNKKRQGFQVVGSMELLRLGYKDKVIIDIIKESFEKVGHESRIMIPLARNSGKLTETEKGLFVKELGVPAGKSYNAHVTNYCREKLLGNIPRAMESFEQCLKERSLLAAEAWQAVPHLSKLEIKHLTPALIKMMKEENASNRTLSLAYLLVEFTADIVDFLVSLGSQHIHDLVTAPWMRWVLVVWKGSKF